MRRAWVLTGTLAAACSTEPSFETGSSSASTGAPSSSSTTAPTSSSTAGDGGDASSAGGAGDGAAGGAGGRADGGGGSTNGPGGGGAAEGGAGGESPCGNGALDAEEECDADSALCVDCRLVCPDPWIAAPSGSRCLLLDVVASTFFESASRCAMLEGGGARARLASPRTLDDLATASSVCASDACWIGLTDLEEEGRFAWLDGADTSFPPGEPPWELGQPDDSGMQDCVGVRGESATLDDHGCSATLPAVCELVPGWAELDRCGDPTVDPGEECQADSNDDRCVDCDRRCSGLLDMWVESPLGEHACYLPLPATAGHDDAVGLCASNGGRLATPDELGDLSVTRHVSSGPTYWLGAGDQRADGTFAWISGEPFDYATGLAPWATDEPNGGSAQNCVVVVSTGELWDYPCSNTDPVPMCERAD